MNNKNKLALLFSVALSTQVFADADFSGQWQIKQAEQATKATEEAIEGVVKEMNFFVRSIARSRLEEEAQVCPSWQLDKRAQTFHWRCAEDESWTVNTHADNALKGDDGRDIYANFVESGNAVSVTLRSERGVRTHQ